ncbi:hypothetical protein [Chryseolinea lacunae]|uniref:Uncharacterized protein n=1 Tax=Chryseolinea lacunae TaxID=2801331 RepID=A0ABS1KP26_9BACT|nr:hypothetical protein [Chryseolinea lacunae]MBL0740983.1 hypothetical protein [Chryseolinea lacunae]
MKKCSQLFLPLLFAATLSHAQLQKNDTTLWLWFDSRIDHKAIIPGKYANDPPNPDSVVHYAISSVPHLYNGYPLEFTSTKPIPSDTIPAESLKDKNTVTLRQLSDFITQNYPRDYVGFKGAVYFKKMKHIYILETTSRKDYVMVTTVRVNVHEGD